MGLGVLEEPFFLIPFKGWMIFFPLKVRKNGPLEDAIVNAKKKMEVWRWVSKNGFVAKMVKNTKI